MTIVDPRTFDLFAVDESVTYPTDTVTIYRDRASLYELHKLEARINKSLGLNVEKLEEAATALRAKVEASSLTIEFKGLPTEVITEIRDSIPATKVPEPDIANLASDDAQAMLQLWQSEVSDAEELRADAMNMKFIEAMLVRITRSDGAVAPHPADRTEEWFKSLPPEDRRNIMECVRDLSFSALEYETETESADF